MTGMKRGSGMKVVSTGVGDGAGRAEGRHGRNAEVHQQKLGGAEIVRASLSSQVSTEHMQHVAGKR